MSLGLCSNREEKGRERRRMRERGERRGGRRGRERGGREGEEREGEKERQEMEGEKEERRGRVEGSKGGQGEKEEGCRSGSVTCISTLRVYLLPEQNDSGGVNFAIGIANALIFVAIILVMTTLLVVLFKYKCYRVSGVRGVACSGHFFLRTTSVQHFH
jgi:hypothetical protein